MKKKTWDSVLLFLMIYDEIGDEEVVLDRVLKSNITWYSRGFRK